jgi:hypothetical protein
VSESHLPPHSLSLSLSLSFCRSPGTRAGERERREKFRVYPISKQIFLQQAPPHSRSFRSRERSTQREYVARAAIVHLSIGICFNSLTFTVAFSFARKKGIANPLNASRRYGARSSRGAETDAYTNPDVKSGLPTSRSRNTHVFTLAPTRRGTRKKFSFSSPAEEDTRDFSFSIYRPRHPGDKALAGSGTSSAGR